MKLLAYNRQQCDNEGYNVYFNNNGVKLGEIYQEVDGEYVFVPEQRGGYWSWPVLLELGQKLKSMNEEKK